MNSFQDYLNKIADYIDMEYGGIDDGYLTDDERHTIKNIVTSHYEADDSINNTASTIALYIRDSRSWMKDNINE
jgi:hypothetical protein